MSRHQVLVALSGGIDSAAVVTLLRESGYEPHALYLDMLDSQAERLRAKQTAHQLDVDLTIEPVAELFQREIVDHLLHEHRRGVTPAPCSRCNPLIKWSITASVADRMGIHHIATGHYVRLTEYKGDTYFLRGIDPAKDQSYYLWGVPRSIRRRAITPLGDYTKVQIREFMALRGYSEIAAQRESMGVCFLGGSSYNEFLRQRLSPSPGEVCLTDGRVVGSHDGYELYTIGQRRGFEISQTLTTSHSTVQTSHSTIQASHSTVQTSHSTIQTSHSTVQTSHSVVQTSHSTIQTSHSTVQTSHSVVQIDPATNRIIVGTANDLLSSTLWLEDWTLDDSYMDTVALHIMIRGIGRNPTEPVYVTKSSEKLLRIDLDMQNRAWAAAKGQPVAIYYNNMVVGGGILCQAE